MPSLRAVFVVTVETKPDGDYYIDQADLVRNVTPWIEGGLDDRDDIRTVTIVEQPAPADQAAILREGANALASLGSEDSLVSGPKAWNEAIEILRRMADEAQQPERCANCGLEVENRGDLSMDGNHHVRWVHVPGGYAICHPQQPDSPRATPRRTDQPSTPADLCQFHAPAGDPCAAVGCGHAAGADCHPRES